MSSEFVSPEWTEIKGTEMWNSESVPTADETDEWEFTMNLGVGDFIGTEEDHVWALANLNRQCQLTLLRITKDPFTGPVIFNTFYEAKRWISQVVHDLEGNDPDGWCEYKPFQMGRQELAHHLPKHGYNSLFVVPDGLDAIGVFTEVRTSPDILNDRNWDGSLALTLMKQCALCSM